MATLQDVIKNNMQIDYGDVAISYLTQDQQNETLPQPICPKWGSSHTIKNGSIHKRLQK
jgi:hypothetical protein